LSTEIRRKLSLHQARNRLTWTWLAMTGPLLLIVILQSITGKYGQTGFESLTGIGWLFQAVLPTASVMIAPITLPINPAVETRSVENLTLLWITICSFVFYFVILYAIILLEPMTDMSLQTLMAMSAWFLAPIQAFILTLVSKFFLEAL
jgi:hypothetical protein